MSEGDVFRAVLDARRAWQEYLEASDEDEDTVYEAYLDAASDAVPMVTGLIELCVEANLIAISARDRDDHYVDLAATDARAHSDAIIEVIGDIVLGHSEAPPVFERRNARGEDDPDTRFDRAREMFREMSRPNVSRAIEELRNLREDLRKDGNAPYAERLSQILGMLQISPPRLPE